MQMQSNLIAASDLISRKKSSLELGFQPPWGLTPPRYLSSMNTTDIKEKSGELEEQVQSWKETARQWQQNAMDTARDAAQATDDYVRENVWSTVALAILAGCALGFLLGRSRD
jgi:ElaB/YqjD/DUF883 family membrane-anchored ribosome-binding protein